MADLIGDLGDAAKVDALLQRAVTALVDQFVAKAIPALKAALVEMLTEVAVTTAVSKKGP
jgi:hypothetical protein